MAWRPAHADKKATAVTETTKKAKGVKYLTHDELAYVSFSPLCSAVNQEKAVVAY